MLQRRLGSTSKFDCSSSLVGLVFLESSVIYTMVAIPLGHLADKHANSSVYLKHMLGADTPASMVPRIDHLYSGLGFVMLFGTFVMLGPYNIGFDMGDIFDNWIGIFAAMTLKGLGSAFGIAGNCSANLQPMHCTQMVVCGCV